MSSGPHELDGGKDPRELAEEIYEHGRKEGTNFVIFTPLGNECTCIRSCAVACVCQEDGTEMLMIQGMALPEGFEEAHLPLAGIQGALYARESAGLSL
jgi:hypothetical protein